jgi:Uncharacterised protein family (UPF0158)
MQECTLDILAGKVLDARAEFDMQLHGEQAYPLKAFEELWLALNQYAAALGDSRSLNRDVAREINGLREYLELESFHTPGEVLAKADRMETILFAGYDPYFEGNEPDTKVVVSIKDVVDEMDVPSDEHSAFLNRHTGELVTLSREELSAAEEDDDIGDYPEWQKEMIIKAKEVIASDDYLPLPSKFDIHEYNIMEDFCFSVADDKIRGALLDKIRGTGAFRRFKDAIHMNEMEEEWYRFRQEALEKIAIDWLEANQIPYTKVRLEKVQ